MMEGKTTLSISHRMDIIKNSDRILVFDKGELVEEGSYDKLIAQKGYLYHH
jgi:ABC-type multidrug transport system fused ATPase/permease subunit